MTHVTNPAATLRRLRDAASTDEERAALTAAIAALEGGPSSAT